MIKPLFVKFQIKFRLIGRLFSLLLAVILCFSLLQNIIRMRRANERLEKARSTLSNLTEEQQLLEQQLKIIKSDDYLEKQARDKLGLAYEGEIVLVLPAEDILKSLSPRKARAEEPSLPDPNWRQWIKLFL
jgi:cell division protein FtsB